MAKLKTQEVENLLAKFDEISVANLGNDTEICDFSNCLDGHSYLYGGSGSTTTKPAPAPAPKINIICPTTLNIICK